MISKFKQWRRERLEKRIQHLDWAVNWACSRTHLTYFEQQRYEEDRVRLVDLQERFKRRYGDYYSGVKE